MTDPSTVLQIPRNIVEAMVDHCRRESPLECCGILGGIAPRVSSFHPLRNAAVSETRYDADPRDLIDAVVSLRARNAEILAIYHSHPRWEAVPSRTDLAENHYGAVPRIIVSLLDEPPTVRIWRLEPDSYSELPWMQSEDAPASDRDPES
jgi:proteasome lid subunit RPN8/RPN11